MTVRSPALEFAARRRALRQAFAPGCAMLTCLLVFGNAPTGLRAPVVIIFFCFVPGTALVGLLNPDSFAVELSLAVALSVAVSGLTAGALVYADLWSPAGVVVIVTAISLVAGLRDFRLGQREGWRASTRGLSDALLQTAQLAGRAAGSVSGGAAAVPRLAGLLELPRRRIALRSRPKRTAELPEPASPLQGFLLEELRQRTGSARGIRWRRPPRSLADLDPNELSELLSWSSLQRYVAQRAIRDVKPELWFVEDLERRLRSRAPDEVPGGSPPIHRGVWITGVSGRTSIPVAWRVLEDPGKEWRTRLALEMLDAAPEPGVGKAVVAADTDFGSLSGFRRGLVARGLSYLVRVDAVTAAREITPDSSSRSAAEARDLLHQQIAAQPQPHDDLTGPQLVVIPVGEQILICEVASAERESSFWLSNLPASTPLKQVRGLLLLANRCRVERGTTDLLQAALRMVADEGTQMEREIALLALAGGLQTLDGSTTRRGEDE